MQLTGRERNVKIEFLVKWLVLQLFESIWYLVLILKVSVSLGSIQFSLSWATDHNELSGQSFLIDLRF